MVRAAVEGENVWQDRTQLGSTLSAPSLLANLPDEGLDAFSRMALPFSHTAARDRVQAVSDRVRRVLQWKG